MRGSPREITALDDSAIPNLLSNFKDLWRDAQQIDFDVLSSDPDGSGMRNGQVKIGVVGGVGKVYVKMADELYAVSLTKL